MPAVNGQNFIVNGRKGLRTYTPCPVGSPSSCSGKWKDLPSMTTERWVIIIGGQTKNIDFDHLKGTDDNPTYEYYPAKSGTWPKTLDILQWAFPHNLFPQSFLMPSGRLFLLVSNRSVIIDPKTEAVTPLPDMPQTDHAPWIYPHTPAMFVLPMTIANKFAFELMICGGNYQSSRNASAACMKINPDDSSPSWIVLENMPNPRLMPDAVLMPDGTVLMVNGLLNGQAGGNQGQVEYAQGPVYATDLFDPAAPSGKRWSTVGQAKEKRLYHSGALLVPSGHVVTTGSEMNNYDDMYPTVKPQCFENPTDPNTSPLAGAGCTDPFNYNIERFTPDYLLKDAQPVIKSAPASATLGSLIQITVKDANSITRVTMVRTSSLTHSTNTDQRFIELVISANTADSLYVKLPTNANQAVPGNWMVFVLTGSGVPSKAAFLSLQVGSPTTATIPATATTKSDGSAVDVTFFALALAALTNLL
ncbi:hypothetical protein HDU91_005245 [Kappamyces sp. JEL0680]|nr:hypothetical protein HDU91_005245 [Kappamyces sp. JEL0680]